MRGFVLAVVSVLMAVPAGPGIAQDRVLVPDRHFALRQNADLPGGDIQSIFDTTIEACQTACRVDDRCTAFTFNSRRNACFTKSAAGAPAVYDGAISGIATATGAAVLAQAPARAAELSFLQDHDFAGALEQAHRLAIDHVAGDWTEAELTAAAAQARASGDLAGAVQSEGAAVTLSDAADQWVEYAQLLLELPSNDSATLQGHAQRAVSAAMNGYLRAEAATLRATALTVMARGLEIIGRGPDMVPALRLAQDLAPRDDIAAALDDAIGKYGFRIQESQVQADSARPRICAVFSQDLASGIDYATYVQLPEAGLSVEAQYNQLCIAGVAHGKRYAVTFREGLPAASGEELAKDVEVTQYVRDRSPAVRFPGRAYILPRAAEAGIPVETVNTRTLDLVLQRVSDRNLIRAIQEDYFGRPLDYYTTDYFNGQIAEEVWRGTADVAMEVNRDMTTRLPLDGVMTDLGPGIYALQASVPGRDPYDNPPASQWFVISDLGMTTLSGTDGLHVFVRGLSDAGGRAGVTVRLVSRANAVIGTAMTDAQGYAQFDAALAAGTGGSAPALVSVEQGEDYAFLSLTEPEFDLSDRGVAGREAAPPIDVFLSTDRGAYRAGETVNATILARDPRMQAIEGLPLTARLMRPDGVEYSRALAAEAGAGGHVVALPVAGNAPRGTWRLEVFADEKRGPLASQALLVEDFLPERIDFTLTLPEGVLDPATDPAIVVDARYLFGAPGAGLAAEGDVRLSAAEGLKAWPGYVFGRHDEPFATVFDSLGALDPTDDAGHLSVPVILPDVTVSRPLDARLTLRLSEGSGRPVERQITRRLLPGTPVIGVKPQFGDGVVPQGTDAGFDVIAIGPDEKPAALPVHWVINRIETDYQWYSVFGNWNWEVTTTRTVVAEGDLSLTAQGPQTIKAPVDWGNHEVVVTAADGSRTATSASFYAGWYAPADAAATPDTLDLSLDKPAYRPGETAMLRIVPRAAGVALVTVMSNHLIDMQAVPVEAGENTIPIRVTDQWGAGAYVSASVIRPVTAEAGRTPVRALGLSYASVDPGAHRLVTTIEAAPEADPRGPLPVAVRVDGMAAGETAYVTIAAVDVGILNLTAFTSPDPEGHYFGQRKLGMAVRDIYGRLIDGQNGAPGTVRSGGDANAGLKMQSPPPTEELVAYFAGPIPVGADGYARTEFTLPSFNGTVRLMAVAWSKSAVGQAEAEVLVRDPVVVTASVPRFLAPGDESRLLLEIVHASGPSGRMGLDVTAGGLTLGAGPSGVDLADKGKAKVSLPITAGPSEGVGTIRVALTTPEGRQLVKVLAVPVQANDPEVMKRSRVELAAGGTFTLDQALFAGFRPGTARATLAVGPLARFDAPGLLAALDRYPYGCTEQLTSRALPLLYFDQVARAVGVSGDADLGKRIDEAITEILLNQSSNGAFGLWYADTGDLWLDAYVTDFLSRARAKGHPVSDTAFRNAMDNLRNQVNYAADFDRDGGPVAYALMVLAREGAAAVGDLRYYADVKPEAFDTPIAAAQLGAALASYGDQTRADAMFARAARLMAERQALPETQVWRADYGTNLRDGAALLALASEAGSTVVPVEALGEAVATAMAGRVLSTQEATWALLATNALIDRDGAKGFALNGAPFAGPLVKVLEDGPVGPVAVTNGSGRPSAVTVTTYGVPEVPEPAGGNGYAIARSWYTLEGDPVDPASVRQGTRMVAVLEVTPLSGGEARLVVNDPLPAGFEIDNPNLIRGGDIAALDWLNTVEETRTVEFRQERFIAAVDWTSSEPFRLAYIVRAVSPGRFHLPAATVEDMYRPDYRARSDAGQVSVTE